MELWIKKKMFYIWAMLNTSNPAENDDMFPQTCSEISLWITMDLMGFEALHMFYLYMNTYFIFTQTFGRINN